MALYYLLNIRFWYTLVALSFLVFFATVWPFCTTLFGENFLFILFAKLHAADWCLWYINCVHHFVARARCERLLGQHSYDSQFVYFFLILQNFSKNYYFFENNVKIFLDFSKVLSQFWISFLNLFKIFPVFFSNFFSIFLILPLLFFPKFSTKSLMF